MSEAENRRSLPEPLIPEIIPESTVLNTTEASLLKLRSRVRNVDISTTISQIVHTKTNRLLESIPSSRERILHGFM